MTTNIHGIVISPEVLAIAVLVIFAAGVMTGAAIALLAQRPEAEHPTPRTHDWPLEPVAPVTQERPRFQSKTTRMPGGGA